VSTQVSELQAAPTPRLAKELLDNTAFLIGRLGFAFKARAMKEIEAEGFSLYDYSVLEILAEAASETQATIADALRVDRGQMVGILDRLEERGLLERKRDPEDRRRHVVSLTSDGRRQLIRLRAIVTGLQDELLTPLSDNERESLHKLLLKLACYHDPRCDLQSGRQ
jgi:MarR family transcriptional regulator, lower aerobic nicotinate degradation pathway regulator